MLSLEELENKENKNEVNIKNNNKKKTIYIIFLKTIFITLLFYILLTPVIQKYIKPIIVMNIKLEKNIILSSILAIFTFIILLI